MYLKAPEKSVPLHELVATVDGEVIGDSNAPVLGLCSLEEPKAHHLCFSRSKSLTQLGSLLGSANVAAVLVSKTITGTAQEFPIPVVKVADPMGAILKLIPFFYVKSAPKGGLSEQADIDPTARIGENVTIGAFCSIGREVHIEDDVILYPHVVLYPTVSIGKGSVLHSGVVVREGCKLAPNSLIQNGAVIGADGFGYIPDSEVGLKQVPQVGSVELGERVEVGANACIDRATLGTTKIGAGTKIDNLVQIGHNTHVGTHSIICGQAGIAGSATIGSQVVLGGKVGVADHIRIVDKVRVAASSAVMSDLLEARDYMGQPAIPALQWKRAMRVVTELPSLIRTLRREKS